MQGRGVGGVLVSVCFAVCEALASASEDVKQPIWQRGLRAPSSSWPPGFKGDEKKTGHLGPTLSPIPFPPILQLSTQSLCALHVKDKPEVEDLEFKAWLQLECGESSCILQLVSQVFT